MPAFALHIDSAKKVFEHLKLRKASFPFALVTIGSVITDIEEFHVLKNVHWRAEEFLQYLLKVDPKYAPLAVGMILHEELDKMLDKDFVNHKLDEADQILNKFGMNNHADASHYLVDHCVNCNALEHEPQIIALAENSKRKITLKDASKIAHHLSNFFGGNEADVLEALLHFRDFNLSQYLAPDQAACVYVKFMLAKQKLTGKPRLWDKIKLAASYGWFLLSNGRILVEEMSEHAKEKFKGHGKSYTKACKIIAKRIGRISSTYRIAMK